MHKYEEKLNDLKEKRSQPLKSVVPPRLILGQTKPTTRDSDDEEQSQLGKKQLIEVMDTVADFIIQENTEHQMFSHRTFFSDPRGQREDTDEVSGVDISDNMSFEGERADEYMFDDEVMLASNKQGTMFQSINVSGLRSQRLQVISNTSLFVLV